VLLLLINSSSYAIDKKELLKLVRPSDYEEDDLIILNSDYIEENPQRAIKYHNQAIEQINNMPFKAFYLIQNGIIYNYYYKNKKDSALKSIIDAQNIFKDENYISEQILCDILKGTVYEKMGDPIRAEIEYKNAYERAKKINEFKVAFIGLLAKHDIDDPNNKNFPIGESVSLINNINSPSLRGYAYILVHNRLNTANSENYLGQFLDSAQMVFESSAMTIEAIDVIIEKARYFEMINNVEKVIQLNEIIYKKSIAENYGKGLIFSCHKLSDFFESINEFEWANIYLRYLNQIKTAEGEKELAERVLLAEKEKKMDLERMVSKNKLEYQGYLIAIGFGIALLILAAAIYIFFAYRTKSKLATDLLLAYNKNEDLKKEKDNFLAYTSHEIRTPLSAVLTTSELLKKSKLNKKQSQLLDTLKNSASNILFLVNDILDLSKLEQRKITLEKKPYSPKSKIQDTLNILNAKAIANHIEIKFETKLSNEFYILGDSFRFQQIMLNLLDNAIKFSPKGVVKVTLEKKSKDTLKIKVIDNGIGIDNQKLIEIFKPYSQEKVNISRQYGGTGLGLAICDQIIQLMKGEIKVKSNDKGTTFSIFIPLKEVLGNEKEIVSDFIPVKEDIKILLAEDDQLNGELFKELLESQYKNAVVKWVVNGVEAIKSLQKEFYDIIVMDIEMPVMNGYKASEEIRKATDMSYSNIPILGMTAHIVEDVMEKCYQSGMSDCISKPFQIEYLTKKINTLSQRKIEVDQKNEFNKSDKYLQIFKTSFNDDLKTLIEFSKEGNMNEILSILHKMKGSSMTMGFNSLGKAITQMEENKLLNLELIETLFHQSINKVKRDKSHNSR
jgi:signal transduction histidine kinase/DNA-binding NarL/FixJ family response regulator